MNRFERSLIVFSLAISCASPALANLKCANVFVQQSHDVRKLVVADAYQQWLLWEQRANLLPYRQPTEPIMMPMVEVPSTKITLGTTKRTPQILLDVFKPSRQSVRVLGAASV